MIRRHTKKGLAKRGTGRRATKRILAVALVVILVALLVPVAYVFERYWVSTGDASKAIAAEQNSVTYVRPLTRLLAALVDAQVAAARGTAVDAATVRAAVENVNRVDRQIGDPLQIRTSWSPLPGQIDAALNQTATGQGAAQAYAVPLALIQALLVKIGDAAGITKDPETSAYHLVDTAVLRLPEVMIDAAQLPALARANRSPLVSSIGVMHDRVARAAEAINAGLRTSAGTSVSDIATDVIKPLDEFAAAVDAMAQALSVSDLSVGSARANVDAAQARVQEASTALQAVTLDAFESSLGQRADGFVTDRALTLVAGVLALVAVTALASLCLYGRAPAYEPLEVEPNGVPADPRGLQQRTGVVDARKLHPEPVLAGASEQTIRRRERP